MALSEAFEEDLVAMVVYPVAFEDVLVVHQPGVAGKRLFFRPDKGRLVVVVVVMVVVFGVVFMVVFGVVQRGVFISVS
jgi:hypothetical protein